MPTRPASPGLDNRKRLRFFCLLLLGLLHPWATRGASAGLVNGDFATGDFTGWTRAAFLNPFGISPSSGGPNLATFLTARSFGGPVADSNAVATSQTQAFDGNGPGSSSTIVPTAGKYLAFLSNATTAGEDTLTGSSISQTFVVPTGATLLSFDVRLLNNDLAAFFGPSDDFGGVALTRGGTVLDQYNLDLDPSSPANAHVTANASAGGFYNSTAWRTHSVDLSGLAGQTLTLTAYVINYGGDDFVESRLLLDHVQIAGAAAAVPEPPSLVLAGFSLFAAVGWSTRRGMPRPRLVLPCSSR